MKAFHYYYSGKEVPPEIVEVDKENVYGGGSDNSGGSNGPSGNGGLSSQHQGSVTPAGPSNSAPPLWYNCRRMIYVPRSAQRTSPNGFWPIPESFWPDIHTATLVSTSALK